MMILFLSLAGFYWIFHNAVWGRVDGGGVAKVSEWVERFFVMIGFVMSCSLFAGFWSFMVATGVVGIATGHGQYFLNRAIKPISPERFDFVVRWVFGEDPRTSEAFKKMGQDRREKAVEAYGMTRLYWRNVFGMFITGSLVGIPAFVLTMVFGKLYGVFFLLTGVVKALAYMIAWKFFKSTEPAEYINGGGRGLITFIVIVFSLLAIMK